MPALRGFTIVELLIVIVVIAILAAITIVAYNGIQNRAQASAVQSDLAAAKKKLLLYQVDDANGQYPSTGTTLASAGITATKSAYDTSSANFFYCYNKTTNQFAMGGRTASAKTAYTVTSTSGVSQAAGAISANTVCQMIGLTGWDDTNDYFTQAYSTGTGWSTWWAN